MDTYLLGIDFSPVQSFEPRCSFSVFPFLGCERIVLAGSNSLLFFAEELQTEG